MALVVNDRVKETSTTTGTGTFDLAGAASGFQTFVAGVGDTNTTYYAIFNQGTTEWEVGLGTVTDAATDTLARTTVITSSNSGSAVDFASGTKDVFCTLPASKAVFGKQEGTNFTDSLLVGHSTTGTLSSALANTGVGIDAMDAITSGDYNTALGFSALSALTSTHNNVALGRNAMKIATGQGNVAVGKDSAEALSNGHYNIIIGQNAGDTYPTSGSGNVLIGNGADADATDSARTLKIVCQDGSTTTNQIIGDGDGNLTFAGTANAAGGQLTTIGISLVMGF